MSSLQKVNLGTPPKAEDGDAVRVANVKANANVDVLNAQSALTSAAQLVDSPQTLTADLHLGRRVNISLAAAGVVQMPDAASCGADGVVLLRNIGTTIATLASKTGSGDSVALSKLNPGEAVLMDTDGVHAWTVLMRGRTNSDDEVVNGNCAVNGNESIGGTLGVTGNATLTTLMATGDVSRSGAAGTSRGIWLQTAASSRWFVYAGQDAESGSNAGSTLYVARYSDAGAYIDAPLSINRATGVLATTQRPTFAGNTPWDSANLIGPATLADAQTFAGAKTFSATSSFTGTVNCSGPDGATYITKALNLYSAGGAGIGFNSGGIGGIWVLDKGSGAFQALRYDSGAYLNITCSSLTQASDEALKTDVTGISGVLSKLAGKRTVSYRLKSDDSGARHIGVIAQEWQDDFPELVVEVGADIDEDGDFIAHQYDDDGNEIFGPNGKPGSRRVLGFNYANASAVAIQGVIELQERLELALARIAELEAK